ncbi:hypothetical protein LIER_22161 [Lithospermum erythrorhizon]|uniref:Uncharacterized protein n=1 Tax=Lithospermum erythrorhizon TaxID=34254 RepID=A0AAV3QTZ7_LITER
MSGLGESSSKRKQKGTYARHGKFRVLPNITLAAIQVFVDEMFRVKVSTSSARKTKEKALAKINGDHLEQFNLATTYCKELMKAQPGSSTMYKQAVHNSRGCLTKAALKQPATKSKKQGKKKGKEIVEKAEDRAEKAEAESAEAVHTVETPETILQTAEEAKAVEKAQAEAAEKAQAEAVEKAQAEEAETNQTVDTPEMIIKTAEEAEVDLTVETAEEAEVVPTAEKVETRNQRAAKRGRGTAPRPSPEVSHQDMDNDVEILDIVQDPSVNPNVSQRESRRAKRALVKRKAEQFQKRCRKD